MKDRRLEEKLLCSRGLGTNSDKKEVSKGMMVKEKRMSPFAATNEGGDGSDDGSLGLPMQSSRVKSDSHSTDAGSGSSQTRERER